MPRPAPARPASARWDATPRSGPWRSRASRAGPSSTASSRRRRAIAGAVGSGWRSTTRAGRRRARPSASSAPPASRWSWSTRPRLGVGLPLRGRGLQMLLTDAAPASLTRVVGCFGRALSLKQLDDGAYLIGGGWPARIPDERQNRWEVLAESVRGSLEVARAVYPPL